MHVQQILLKMTFALFTVMLVQFTGEVGKFVTLCQICGEC